MERAFAQSLVFWVSDFEDPAYDGDFAELLRPAAKKFEFIPVVIRDPLETTAPLKGSARITVKDSEGIEGREVYLTPRKLQEFQEVSAEHVLHLETNFRNAGIDHVVLDSPSIEDCHDILSGFFQGRRRTKR